MEDVLKRNAVRIYGSGNTTMLLAPGYGVDQRIWRLLAPEFARHFKVVVLDYVGSGESDRTCYSEERYSSLEGYARDIIEISDLLGIYNGIFVGHSISCMIGLLAALERPDLFRKFVFIAPSPCYVNETANGYRGGFEKHEVSELLKNIEQDYVSWAHRVIPQVINNADKPSMIKEILNMFLTYDQRIARQFATHTFFADHRKELLHFAKPCLILQASQDMMVPLEVGDYLHAHLRNSELRVLKARGHFPQLTDSHEVMKRMVEYLSTEFPSLIDLKDRSN